ncbi:trypsin-like peptidase domain-containing protein [Niallia sp. Krafla_26]|uniref:trypsin-like peptidase domain-containing protein n=1 Tax=Niallia sp. Krafla_26 TaxID=3064703 RepID=UPI003D16AEAF
MNCPSCGEKLYERSTKCPNCGKQRKSSKRKLIFVLTLLSVLLGITVFKFFSEQTNLPTQSAATKPESYINFQNEETKKTPDPEPDPTPVPQLKDEVKPTTDPMPNVVAKPVEEIEEETIDDITYLIADSQSKVFTIFTGGSQGSGFLMNQRGDIITNAHVIEGFTWVTIKDWNGVEYQGQVIGYSNDTDIALIRVQELAGKTPMKLETVSDTKVGEEIIAIGSPQGVENTATLGFITGINRSFNIGQRTYENLYQMSAPISAGSSGGPLLSKESGKAIAINSAKMLGDEPIGFSIPIKAVYSIILQWSEQPMDEKEIHSLFYNELGDYYFEDLWETEEEGYFDGGEITEEEDINSYYEIPEEWVEEIQENDISNSVEENTEGSEEGVKPKTSTDSNDKQIREKSSPVPSQETTDILEEPAA